MRGDTFITFRGDPDTYVKWKVDASGPGTGCEVEWHFPSLTPAQHDVLNITSEEEDAIIDECIAAYNSKQADEDFQ
jgi:hypothetical protein